MGMVRLGGSWVSTCHFPGESPLTYTYRSLLYLPLTSLFYPILSIPQTLDRVFSPSKMFLTRYAESFNDGTQIRAYERFKEEATNGGAGKLLMSVRGHWAKQVQERIDELEREKSEKMDKMRKMGKDMDGKEVD